MERLQWAIWLSEKQSAQHIKVEEAEMPRLFAGWQWLGLLSAIQNSKSQRTVAIGGNSTGFTTIAALKKTL